MKSKKRQYNKKSEFYDKKFDTLVNWVKDKNKNIEDENNKIKLPWNNVEAFTETYLDYRRKGSKNPLKTMEYRLQYKTDYNTVMAERAWLKAHNKELISLKELKTMTTQDFYDKFKDDIEEYRKEAKAQGVNSYRANKMISNFFFGSN